MIRVTKGCVGPGGVVLAPDDEREFAQSAEDALVRMGRAVRVEPARPQADVEDEIAVDEDGEPDEQRSIEDRETATAGDDRETAGRGRRRGRS